MWFSPTAAPSPGVIIGADGIKSQTRELVLGSADKPKSSGYACYRAYFGGAHLRTVWIGHDMHLVRNTLRDGEELHWILTHKGPAREYIRTYL